MILEVGIPVKTKINQEGKSAFTLYGQKVCLAHQIFSEFLWQKKKTTTDNYKVALTSSLCLGPGCDI